MQLANPSPCGRFIVLDGLHLDRVVFETLATWASKNELRLQDAIQLAICAFNDGSRTTAMTPSATMASGAIVRIRSTNRVGSLTGGLAESGRLNLGRRG
jgi:hypothetical protein